MKTLPDTCWNWILSAEGGEVNNAADRGGHTRYGISQRAYPDIDIASLTPDEARDIYARDYWEAAHCNQLPEPVATAHFDAAVNHGVWRASILLQRALRVAEDGIIGPVTLARVEQADPLQLLLDMLGHRALFYHRIVANDASQNRFLHGWLLRTYRLTIYLLTKVL